MKKNISGKDKKAKETVSCTEVKQEGSNQLQVISGENPSPPDLFNCYLSPSFEQCFPFTYALHSRDYSSPHHSNRPETFILVQEHQMAPILLVEDLNFEQPQQQQRGEDRQQQQQGEDGEQQQQQQGEDQKVEVVKEEYLQESIDQQYRKVLNEFNSDTATFQTQPLFCKQEQSDDNQLTKLLCFKPNRKNARNLRYDDQAKTVISVYICYGCSKQFLVSSALGGHLSKCSQKAKHCEYIKQKAPARSNHPRSNRPHPVVKPKSVQEKDIHLKLEDFFPIPGELPFGDTEGKLLQMEMKEQNPPSPVRCSEFSKILNHVKIEESPQYFTIENQMVNSSVKTKPIEKTKRATRNSTKVSKQKQQQARERKKQQEIEDDVDVIDFGNDRVDGNEFLMSGDFNREQQNWDIILHLDKQ